MLCVNGLFPSLFCFTWIKLNDCDDVIILPLMNLVYMSLWYLYMYVTPCPMVMWLFQPYIQIFKYCFISGPVKSLLRDPSLEENTSFFLKWFLLLPWSLPFYNLGTFWVLTNWRHCRGMNEHICPGRTTKLKKGFCGKTGIFNRKEVVFFPGDSIVKLVQNLRSHFGFEKTHTR